MRFEVTSAGRVSWKIIWVPLVALYLLSDLYAFLSNRVWFTDAGIYFLGVLERGHFEAVDLMRTYGEFFLQFPLVLALRLGLTDLTLLSHFYGAPFFLQFPLSLLICLKAAGRENARFLFFPLLSLFAGSMNGNLLIWVPHTMVCFFWALLFSILFREKWSLGSVALFVGMAVVSLRTYESMLYLGLILAIAAVWRTRKEHSRYSIRLAWLSIASFFFAGSLITSISLIHYPMPENMANFKYSILHFLGNPFKGTFNHSAFLSILTLLFLPLCLIRKESFDKPFKILSIFFAALIAVGFLHAALFPRWFHPSFHYSARSFYSLLPLFLSPVLLIIRGGYLSISKKSWERAFLVLTVLACGQIFWQFYLTTQWNRYLNAFREELAAHRGLIAYENSKLPETLNQRHILNMQWGWTYPLMSLLVVPKGRVVSILENKKPLFWEPFDPALPENLPKLERYGISYESFLEALPKKQKADEGVLPRQPL